MPAHTPAVRPTGITARVMEKSRRNTKHVHPHNRLNAINVVSHAAIVVPKHAILTRHAKPREAHLPQVSVCAAANHAVMELSAISNQVMKKSLSVRIILFLKCVQQSPKMPNAHRIIKIVYPYAKTKNLLVNSCPALIRSTPKLYAKMTRMKKSRARMITLAALVKTTRSCAKIMRAASARLGYASMGTTGTKFPTAVMSRAARMFPHAANAKMMSSNVPKTMITMPSCIVV
jgi:hypothetical protein